MPSGQFSRSKSLAQQFIAAVQAHSQAIPQSQQGVVQNYKPRYQRTGANSGNSPADATGVYLNKTGNFIIILGCTFSNATTETAGNVALEILIGDPITSIPYDQLDILLYKNTSTSFVASQQVTLARKMLLPPGFRVSFASDSVGIDVAMLMAETASFDMAVVSL